MAVLKPTKKDLSDKPLSEMKKMELSIRNDVLARILGWQRFSTSSGRYECSAYDEPQAREYWYQRQENTIYFRIFYGGEDIAHYHKRDNLLEILSVSSEPIRYAQKLLDGQLINHIDSLKVTHGSCRLNVTDTPEQNVEFPDPLGIIASIAVERNDNVS